MVQIPQIFLISLRRKYETRGKISKQSFMNAGFSVDIIQAIDGRNIDKYKVAHPLVISNMSWKTKHYSGDIVTMGEIGCMMSHANAWKKCVQLKKPVLIVEDDVRCLDKEKFIKSCQNIPQDADVVFLYHLINNLKPYDYVGFTEISPQRISGTQAYWIHPTACKKLLLNAYPVVLQSDAYMAAACETYKLKVYARKCPRYTVHLKSTVHLGSSLFLKQWLPGSEGADKYYVIFIILVLFSLITGLVVFCQRTRMKYIGKYKNGK